MYAGGQPHPLHAPCVKVLTLARDRPQTFFTNVEVLQETLHRYLAIGAWSCGKLILEEFVALTHNRIETVIVLDVDQAAALADQYPGLSARDLLHVAVMARLGATQIVSADRGFGRIGQVERLDPADVDTWQTQLSI
jgi:uncharacterized protein